MTRRVHTGRILVAAATAIVAALAAAAWPGRETPPAVEGPVLLLYVGADDCAPCRAWQGEARSAFLASSQATRVAFREVKAPRLFDALDDAHWPEDLRPYRARLTGGAALPTWFVVTADGVIEQRSGVSQWEGAVLPRLRSLLR